MSQLTVTLFGRLNIECRGQALELSDSQKAQELFCFLLLHRNRSYSRESLASMLWEHCTTAQSKAYLRKALWQLQQGVGEVIEGSDLLLVESEWIQFNPDYELQVDVELFEEVHRETKGKNGWELDASTMEHVQKAIWIYKGDLLENWYLDWCLYERERLQQMYLVLLDKSMDYFELHGEYEAGIDCGNRILQIDRARENTHQRLMRLCYLNGDRTGALRQYQRCTSALREELDTEPSTRTTALFEQIRQGRELVLTIGTSGRISVDLAVDIPVTTLSERIARLQELYHILNMVQAEIGRELNAVESGLHHS